MNESMQEQIRNFREVVSQEKASVNAKTGQGKEDSLSKAIRNEKDGKNFMAELKNAKDKAR